MKTEITNAAEISVLPLIDNTYKTGGGPFSVGATVVRSPRGPVGEIVECTARNWERIFGTPYPKSVGGAQMEGLRHLADAAKECSVVYVARVVAEDAKYPHLSVIDITDKGAWDGTEGDTYEVNDVVEISGGDKLICVTEHTNGEAEVEPTADSENWEAFTTSYETGSTAYGTDLAIDEGYVLQIFPVDGDPCENRSFEITPVLDVKGGWTAETEYAKNDVVTIDDGTSLVCRVPHTSGDTEPTVAGLTAYSFWEVQSAKHERFHITFYDKNDLGIEYVLEEYDVGVRATDKDDMGRPAFIENLLEQRSQRFRANYNSDLAWASIQDGLLAAGKVAFAGGTNGSDPTDEDWVAAWDMFRDDDIYYYLMFAAGCNSAPALANCIDIAETKHVSFFFDVSPNLNPENALAWIYDTGLHSRQAAAYYSPWAADDLWYGGKTVWGVSGAVAAACAKGNQHYSGATPGVHYSPAGEKRGKLDRTGVQRLFPDFTINRDDFYNARLNPVIAGMNGGAVIDDSLALHFEANYSRFIWVNRIGDYIIYRFYELATQVKHEPDGITKERLELGMKEIMDAMVTSGAVVEPRDQDTDGPNPYVITVEQEEIDLWMVYWEFCPTGSARRIAGQPILIK